MYIIKETRNNSTYVYQAESYRDEKGRPRKRKKYLGRLDKDNVLISAKTNLPAEITEVKTITKKFIVKDKN